MALDTHAKIDAAIRLCRAVTGDEYGIDYDRITGIGIGIAEPYGDTDTVWVTGNWNDVIRYGDDGTRTIVDNRYGRLFDALERIGVSGEWLDEHHECYGCQKLIRTQPDCYSWQPAYITTGDGYFCRECSTGDFLDDTLAEYIGDDNKALTASLIDAAELESAGFVRFNIPPAEHGWHPHQTDTAAGIVAMFEAEHGNDAEWLFYIDETSQFYIRFTLFYRAGVTDNV